MMFWPTLLLPTLGGGGTGGPRCLVQDVALGVPVIIVSEAGNVGVLALAAGVAEARNVEGKFTGDAGVGVIGTAGWEEDANVDIAFRASRRDKLKSAFFLIAESRSLRTN